jgi:hypothetical protein
MVAVWNLCSTFNLIMNEMFTLYFHSHKCGSIVKLLTVSYPIFLPPAYFPALICIGR